MNRFLLSTVLILAASPCYAGLVDHSSPSVAAQHQGDSCCYWLLLADGSVWYVDSQALPQFVRAEDRDPPLTISDLRFWDLNHFVTMDGHVWKWMGETYQDLGPVPIGPISTDQQGVGSMKAGYKTQQKADEQD